MSEEESLAPMLEYLSENEKHIQLEAVRLKSDLSTVQQVLELVRKFIVGRKLILFGGLAIDYALRLKGDALYKDFELPDYDCYSPTCVSDAYALVDTLIEAEYDDNTGAIRAIHPQTLRVRYNFNYVMDVGYIEPSIFDGMPTLTYEGMRIIHPHYQVMDLHLSFCFPYNNPPMEDILHRWPKDSKRIAQLLEHYPIKPVKRLEFVPPLAKAHTVELPKTPVCFYGLAAFALFCEEHSRLLKVPKVYDKYILNVSKSEVRTNVPLELITYDRAVEPTNAAYLDYMLPFKYIDEQYTLYCGHNKLLASAKLVEPAVTVVSYHYLIVYLLCRYFALKDDAYLNMYCHLVDMVAEVQAKYPKYRETIFFHAIEPFGQDNYNLSYQISIAKAIEKTTNVQQPILTYLPDMYYGKKQPPPFNYNNPIFNRSAQPIARPSTTVKPVEGGRVTFATGPEDRNTPEYDPFINLYLLS